MKNRRSKRREQIRIHALMILTEHREVSLSDLFLMLQQIPVCRSVRYHAIGQILKAEFEKGILKRNVRYDNGRQITTYVLVDEEE